MGGDQVQDATMSQTRCQDAQDAQDANLTSLASGGKVDACDATEIFADAQHQIHRGRPSDRMLLAGYIGGAWAAGQNGRSP